jgi:hypothetical protein
MEVLKDLRADGVKAVAAEGGGASRASLEAVRSLVYFKTVAPR